MRRRCRRDTRFDGAQQVHVAIERVVERGAVHGGRFLRDMRDAPRRRHGEIAAVRVQLAAQHREERGLARAVCADETGFFARIEREARLFEERLGAAGQAELIETDHVGLAARSARIRE